MSILQPQVATPTKVKSRRLPLERPAEIYYPESDGEPMGETDIHVDEIATLLKMLKSYYHHAADVHVAANSFIYYEEGDITARFCPDLYVVFGVPKRLRRTYRLWVEKLAPAFIMEVSSRKTWLEDTGNKKALCAHLGVTEYFLYDPEHDYLEPPLQGFRLVQGIYQAIQPEADGSLLSETLNLKLRLEGNLLQLFDIETGERFLRPEETEAARRAAESARRTAETRAAEAEARAVAEAQARYEAEARLAELQAEIERLHSSG